MSRALQYDRDAIDLRSGAAIALAVLATMALACGIAAELAEIATQRPRDALGGSLGDVASLTLHNLAVAGIPLVLAAIGYDQVRYLRSAGDLVVAALLVSNGANVGIGFARAGTELVPYLPHLPIEWAAIATGAATWIVLRLGPPPNRRRHLLTGTASVVVLLVIAAALEALCSPVFA